MIRLPAKKTPRLSDACLLTATCSQAFHWNVTGPHFEPLHTIFQEQYTEFADTIDEIAKRIRALGAQAPGGFCEFASLISIDQETGVPAAAAMVGQLQSDHAKMARSALQTARLADTASDVATADLATQRVTWHEKAAWMSRSLLQP